MMMAVVRWGGGYRSPITSITEAVSTTHRKMIITGLGPFPPRAEGRYRHWDQAKDTHLVAERALRSSLLSLLHEIDK